MKSITIITTFKDDYPDLLRTIKSIQSQKNIKIFHILLNASEKGPRDSKVVQYFNSTSVFVVNSQGLGQYVCFNAGIRLVKTKYFMLMNSGTTFVDRLSVCRAMEDVSNESIVINQTTVTSPFARDYIRHISKVELPFGVHHEACIYSDKSVMHNLKIGHIADLDFISRHLSNKASILIRNSSLIYYPRGGISDQKPIDRKRVVNTAKVSVRLLARRQYIAALLLCVRAVKDLLLYLKK